MPLTREEKTDFVRQGLLVRRGFVPPELVKPASSLVNDWLGEDMDPSQITAYTQRTFAPDLGEHPYLLSLFTDSGACDLAVDLLGAIQPVTTTQIQVRMPEGSLPVPQPEKTMHVDGVACPHLATNELRTFTLLVGVVLSDITDSNNGPLRYLPGGHLTMAEWFRSEWPPDTTAQVPSQVDRDGGTPFLGAPGDVLFMHHLVPHSVGRNHSPTPRVMAYFRVSHPRLAQHRLEALRDPWLSYPPLATLSSTPTPAR